MNRNIEDIREPTQKEIQTYMTEFKENFYNARERLREKVYGGLPPNGFSSWVITGRRTK